MKTLGIIGGIGPESTIEYYRHVFAGYQRRVPDGGAPNLIINSIDLQKLLGLAAKVDHTELVEYLLLEVQALARAGAELALLAANTPHLVFEQLRERHPGDAGPVMQQFRAKRWGRLRWNRRCPVITWAVAPPAVSQVHSFGSSLRASLSRLPQTIAETRVPTVRRPSPRRRVAQLGPTLRIGAGQTMGDAILSRDR